MLDNIMSGLIPENIREIHSEIVRDIDETYRKELSYLEYERKTIELLKKYEARIIVKHIFQKAKWKPQIKSFGPTNLYAEIIINFFRLVKGLEFNQLNQIMSIQYELKKIDKEYARERKEQPELTPELPRLTQLRSTINKIDKKALYTLRRLYILLNEINQYCRELDEMFRGTNKLAKFFSSNPQKFHEIFIKICKSINHKNETLKLLHKVMKYETELGRGLEKQ